MHGTAYYDRRPFPLLAALVRAPLSRATHPRRWLSAALLRSVHGPTPGPTVPWAQAVRASPGVESPSATLAHHETAVRSASNLLTSLCSSRTREPLWHQLTAARLRACLDSSGSLYPHRRGAGEAGQRADVVDANRRGRRGRRGRRVAAGRQRAGAGDPAVSGAG